MDGSAIRETADGVAVLGEKLTRSHVGRGLTLGDITLHGWVSKAWRESNTPKNLTWRRVALPPACKKRCQAVGWPLSFSTASGRFPDPQGPLSLSGTLI